VRGSIAGLAMGLLLAAAAGANAAASNVYLIDVAGAISPATDDFIASAIERAHAEHAAALVVRLDTPGGLLDSTKTIVKGMLAAPLPVLVYVAPGGAAATSAGVFITLAGHVAAMAPGTTIGAAHPVSGQGGNLEGDLRAKVESFAVSFIASIAKQRGRNVRWAKRAVRRSVSITEVEAEAKNVVDFVADDVGHLLKQAQGKKVDVGGVETALDFSPVFAADGTPSIVPIEMTVRQKVLRVITDPNIAYLLMMAGMLGLYFELSTPGAILPGVVGAICLLLALLAGHVLPISSIGGLLLALGMAFLIAEMFLPSFGVLGLGGIVALTLGALFLYTPESQLRVDRSLIATTTLLFGAVVATIAALLWRDRSSRPMTGSEGMVGEIGQTITPIFEDGKVRVHGELWNAISSEPIAPNRRVTVEAVEGLRLRVREEGK